MDVQRRYLIGGAAGLAAVGGAAGLYRWLRTPEPPPGRTDAARAVVPATPGASPRDAGALWAIAFEQPSGGMLRLEAFRGRALLVNFWATWCAPCVKEMPLLDRWASEQRDVAVVGIAVDRMAAVRDFLKRTPVGFPIGVAGFAGTELARSLGNPQGALPYSVLVGRDGRLVTSKLGETHDEDLRAWSRMILAQAGDSNGASA